MPRGYREKPVVGCVMWVWFLRLVPFAVQRFFSKYAILILVSAVLMAVGIVFWQGYRLGKASAENKSMSKAIEVQDEKDTIRNNRPDDTLLFRSLRIVQY